MESPLFKREIGGLQKPFLVVIIVIAAKRTDIIIKRRHLFIQTTYTYFALIYARKMKRGPA